MRSKQADVASNGQKFPHVPVPTCVYTKDPVGVTSKLTVTSSSVTHEKDPPGPVNVICAINPPTTALCMVDIGYVAECWKFKLCWSAQIWNGVLN